MEEKRLQELKEKVVKNSLPDLTTETLVDIYNNVTGEYVWDDLESMIYDLNLSGYEAVSKFNFGDCNFNDDYWMLSVYGNFKSFTAYNIDEELISDLEEYLPEIAEEYEAEFDFSTVEDAEDIGKDVDHYLDTEENIKKEFNEFVSNNCMFAFSEEQFKEGLEKLNCKETDLVSIGYGGYTKAYKVPEYKSLLDIMDAKRKEAKEDESYLVGMFYYEMGNHEYGYTRDITDTLHACGVNIADIESNEKLKNAFEKAQDVYLRVDDLLNE